jgi:hypothetical protein
MVLIKKLFRSYSKDLPKVLRIEEAREEVRQKKIL